MVGRVLFWLLLGLIAWWIVRPRKAAPPKASPRAGAGAAPATMVDCAHCGLHFPADEAVRDGARVFCCTAHRDLGPRRDT